MLQSTSKDKPKSPPASSLLSEPASDWLATGKFGTTQCVLRFSLAALKNTNLFLSTDNPPITIAPTHQSAKPLAGTSSKALEPKNGIRSLANQHSSSATFPDKILHKKRAHESLSSSDTSIASSFEDTADMMDEQPVIATSSSVQRTTRAFVDNSEKVAVVKAGAASGKENRVTPAAGTEASSSSSGTCELFNMPAMRLRICYRFANTETRLLRRILNSHGLQEVDETKEVHLVWSGAHMKTDLLRHLKPHQRVNHFPRSSELTRKDRLYKNIVKMQHLRGFKQFDIVPTSFMLPLEYRSLLSMHRSSQKMPWIVKPAASSRGRGIFLVNSPEQIPKDEQGLVSRYIANPLCIDGHKCDIRLYVVVTSYDPLIVYLHEEGLVRLATVKYDKNDENLWNACMHLCNYSINKYHSDYIKANEQEEDVGHKWTFSALLRHLRQQGSDTEELMANIEDVIVKSILACTQSVASACRMFVPSGNNCFELYGYDILIDDQLKPWLLEVNMSPSLGIDTPLDTKVKASVVTDLLTLIGIPAVDASSLNPSDGQPSWSRYRNAAGLERSRKSMASTQIHNSTTSSSKRMPGAPKTFLTQEEQRIVRQARFQHSRRGGYVRIFPTVDSMQKYGYLLDTVTGIPMSTVAINGSTAPAMILPHNFNLMLHNQLFESVSAQSGSDELKQRMAQYERVLCADDALLLIRQTTPKSVVEAIRMRRMMSSNIENNLELSQLQARRLFHRYLECVLMRLATEPPKTSHQEKCILKFITRSDAGRIKAPSFIRNPSMQQSTRIHSKDRNALVAKLLGDYLDAYHRDTESYVDDFDRPGIIPRRQFNDFLSLGQENDLESILTLHTNITQSLPFLNSRESALQPPPIPSGVSGFLRALPAMVRRCVSNTSIENYYKSLKSVNAASTGSVTKLSETNDVTDRNQQVNKIMSTSINLPNRASSVPTMAKRRSISQSSIFR